jgi:hypothetical protein
VQGVCTHGLDGVTPTARSLKLLRDDGWFPWIVEKYNSFTKQRSDLFGFIDILAIRGTETLGVQSTSGTNVSARVRKITDHEHVARVREAGWLIHVHGWAKNAKGRWVCRVVDLS